MPTCKWIFFSSPHVLQSKTFRTNFHKTNPCLPPNTTQYNVAKQPQTLGFAKNTVRKKTLKIIPKIRPFWRLKQKSPEVRKNWAHPTMLAVPQRPTLSLPAFFAHPRGPWRSSGLFGSKSRTAMRRKSVTCVGNAVSEATWMTQKTHGKELHKENASHRSQMLIERSSSRGRHQCFLSGFCTVSDGNPQCKMEGCYELLQSFEQSITPMFHG